MRWYVMSGTQTVGPVDADLVGEFLRSGRLRAGAFVRDESGGAWLPVEQSPFAAFVQPARNLKRSIGSRIFILVAGVVMLWLVGVLLWVLYNSFGGSAVLIVH